MRIPTNQQLPILDCQARIRLVSAVPGSGKTWLIGERIRRSLAQWKFAHRGVAAVSFTNTARDEIVEALGYEPGHPHFAGTLDSFVFRYLIKPFGHLYCDGFRKVRIVPAAYAEELADDQSWFQSTYIDKDGKPRQNKLTVVLQPEPRKVAHVFTSNFVEMQGTSPILSMKERFRSEPTILTPEESGKVLNRKREIWQKSGRVSHSDCGFVAFQLLSGPHGAAIKEILARRFPVIVVDELQDTGFFLGNVLLLLLQNAGIKAMLVGDPDQAIFEFSGARPDLFGRFGNLVGAKTHLMSSSQRCPKAVRDVATQLASSKRVIDGDGRQGFAGIGWYTGDGHVEIQSFATSASALGCQLRILARKNSELYKLRGVAADDGVAAIEGSKPLEKLRRAVSYFRGGNVSKALSLAEGVLARMLLESDHPTALDLQEAGVSPLEWRTMKLSLLTRAYSLSRDGSLSVWCREIVTFLKNSLAAQGWFERKPKLLMPRVPKNLGNDLWPEGVISDPSLSYLTVHKAKGQTHDTTLFFVAKPGKNSPCPSVSWFEEESEERRIAFVAATRAQNNFVLCLPLATLDRLRIARLSFVESFTVVAPLVDLIPHLKPSEQEEERAPTLDEKVIGSSGIST